MLKTMLDDPYYKVCARAGLHGHICDGRITFEHVLIYAGRQVQEYWAIIPLCECGHSVDHYQDMGDLNKSINVWIALNRATDDELRKYSKAVNYIQLRATLNLQYGVYTKTGVCTTVPRTTTSSVVTGR